ncbi:pectinesterase 2-like [Pyrus communis]|uniref:pectinesterase 2-like n=1 Tax=Pyrus communis TaxID=23211 RepID=UPI0035BF6F55
MATNLSSFVLCVSFVLFFSHALSNILHTSIDSWCEKTPYPETCKYTMTQDEKSLSIPKQPSKFKKLAVQVTLERALKAQSHNKWLGQKCRNKKERAAWADCMSLYEETIKLLNQTIDTATKCTDYDTQTWLSTALTNLDTCRAGFVELAVSDFVFPLMSNNVSKLISNTLSLWNSSNVSPLTNMYTEGYPSWVSPGNRKLLQSTPTADVVVAQDGSGNYKTIKAALDAAAARSGSKRFVIHVKRGVYKENLEIKLKNIYLLGDGLRYTIITGSRSVVGGSTTFKSATVAVTGEGFIARGITFRNTAGPENHQAVALRSGADLSVFYRCGFEGYQDTLYTHSQRQFYRECYVYGTVDFIFGNAAVVFQNCMIYARKPMSGQQNTITAQGRTDPNQNTGISIHDSRVMAALDFESSVGSVKTFLGRPWKEYSRTVFLQSFLDTLVDPAGWLKWNGDFALKTLYYGEYKNIGPGAPTTGRVKWGGYRIITSSSEASKFTVDNFIAGSSWLPATNVAFAAGL